MLRGIYNVASAMEMASRNQEIIAENLTNSVTPGYRRQGLVFEVNGGEASAGEASAAAARRPNAGSSGNPRSFSSFDAGPLQQTSNPFDLALVGTGYFVLDGPNGPLYTRNGGFERNAQGELQTPAGYRLRGSAGAIRIPEGATRIDVSADGTVSANAQEIGKLQLATFAQPEAMRRVGNTLFSADNPQTPLPGAVRVQQGFREGSNVQPVREMVAMILGMRHYQAAEKAMSALSDAVAQNTRSQQP